MPAGRAARAIRLLTTDARVQFDDAVLGPQERDLEHEAGDFVLYRADGVFAFHLASAVDDGELGMTDIVRGADLLESSARQIHVLRLLGLTVPRYAHLPVALNAQGEKLSKQTLAQPVDASTPSRVLIAALRFLGQSPPEELSRASGVEVWEWAIANWRIDQRPQDSLAP